MMAKTKNLVPLFVILASFLIFNVVNSAENNIDLSLFHLWNSICLGPETNQLWNCPEESSMCTEKEQGWLDTLNVNLLEGHAKNPLELFDCLDNLNGKIRLYYKCNSYIPGGFPVFGWTDSWWFGNSAWKYLYETDSLWCWISGSRTDTTYVDSTLRYAYRECASKSSFGGYYVAHEFNVDNPRAESLYYHGWDYMIHYAESLDSDLSHVKAVASAVAGTRHHTDPELTRIADSLDVFDAYHYVFAETTDLVQASPETQLPLDNLAFHYDTTRSFFKDSHTRWAAATQACACWRRRGGQITRNHRFPTREEIRVQAFMALLRGAKGIIQFSYASQWGDGDGELIFGLVNYKRNGKTRPWDDPLYYDYYDSPYDVEPFYHVAELYGDLQKLGPYFGRTYSTDVYAVADTQDVNGPIIRRIEGVYIDAGTFFDSTTADSTLYFMLVNRVCHADNNGTPADSQQVTVTIRAPDGLNSYLIKDMYTGQVTAIPQDSLDQNNDFEFTTVIPPGDGQLFLLKPAIRGIYNNDLTWSGTILIDGDIVFGGDPQPTLTVEPNTEIYFLADHDYYRTGGADSTKCELRVWGDIEAVSNDSTKKITFTSSSPDPDSGDWYGIFLKPQADGNFKNCVIEYAVYGIRGQRYNEISVEDCQIRKSYTAGIYAKKGKLDVTGSEFYGNWIYGIACDRTDFRLENNVIQETVFRGIQCDSIPDYTPIRDTMYITGNDVAYRGGLDDSKYGITLNYNNRAYLADNIIKGFHEGGIICSHSSPYAIAGNTIDSVDIRGLHTEYGSSPLVRENLVANAYFGVLAELGSYPDLGDTSSTGDGNNSIVATDSFRVANRNTDLDSLKAENNWWGTAQPTNDMFDGRVDWHPYLTSAPQPEAKAVARREGLPDAFALRQNYPNPFNPSTMIEYDLPKASHVLVQVYNILGQRLVTLKDGYEQPGYKVVRWNGRSDSGELVATGVYFYLLKTDEFRKVKKMVMIR